MQTLEEVCNLIVDHVRITKARTLVDLQFHLILLLHYCCYSILKDPTFYLHTSSFENKEIKGSLLLYFNILLGLFL